MNMDTSPREELPTKILVAGWDDPIVEAQGHWPGDLYLEYCWLPVVGPTTLLLWVRLSRTCVEGFVETVDLHQLARSFGLADSLGSNAPLARSLRRMVQFGCAKKVGEETFVVRRALPHLSRGHLARLPQVVREAHEYFLGVGQGS
jgi:hypothetical protein